MNIKFSVIIPHKNTPELLFRCVRSIPVRGDIEIIIVDDGSDVSLEKLETDLISYHPQVRFLSIQDSKGAGAARNLGLVHAKGIWVVFADSDDFFNYCFNQCLNNYCDCHADIVFFKANSVNSYSYVNAHRSLQLNSFVELYRKKDKKGASLLRYRFGEPWAKMIRKDLIDKHSIKFDETIVHNDTLFSLLTGFYARDIVVDDRAIYCCTVRKDSVSLSKSNLTRLVRIDVFSRVELFFDENSIPIRKINKHFIALSYLFILNFTDFKRGCKIMKELGFSYSYILLRMVLTFPYFVLDLNKDWVRILLYKIIKL